MKILFQISLFVFLLADIATSLSFNDHLDKGILPTEPKDSACKILPKPFRSCVHNTNWSWFIRYNGGLTRVRLVEKGLVL
ncbi:hypothetical protein CDEST_07973 [Colletotrichum destructivum]|uniref:Uncharacterized protein n=1 Tax=Colletotrichum destructivum TaxID=34406 RepID=A0AAX4IJC4_9PEZI|nr:hypothetical protein CDEST_07973 [Colletotrichum destructivum]